MLDTPEALKASVGKDRVQIQTDDDEAAIAALRERFGIEATIAEGAVTFGVPAGEQFVPRLFAELGQPIRSVSVSRPSLDDVFMSYTGTTIRDAEESGADRHAAQHGADDEPLMATDDDHDATRRADGHRPAPPRERARRTRSRACTCPRAACAASCARSRSCGSAS